MTNQIIGLRDMFLDSRPKETWDP